MIVWHFWFNHAPLMLIASSTVARSYDACMAISHDMGFGIVGNWHPYGFKLERAP